MKITDFVYERVSDGYRITGYNGKSRDIEIPEGVSEIGISAFSWSNIESVVIASSVRVIGCEAFSYCETLTEVSFEEGSKLEVIESHAFLYCEQLREIDLPEGLREIGEFAFANCDSLRRAYLPSTLMLVEENAFEDRGTPFLIELNMASVPSGFADKWNMLAKFELSGSKAKTRNALPSASVSNIKNTPSEKQAWPKNTPTASEKQPQQMPLFEQKTRGTSAPKTDHSLKKAISDYLSQKKAEEEKQKAEAERQKAEADRKAAENRISQVSAQVQKQSQARDEYTPMYKLIVEDTRYGRKLVKCLDKELTELIVPPEINIIGCRAFMDRYPLKRVVGHQNLKVIENEAFMGCTNLSEIDISPKTSLAAYALCGTAISHAKVSFVTFDGVFSESAVKTASFVTVDGYGVNVIRPFTFAKSKLERIDIPEGVDSVMTGAFSGCDMLKEVRLPASLYSLESSAFSSCRSLKEIKLPRQIREIPSRCFAFCEGLESINLENVSVIGNDAFYNCNSLRTLRFSPSLRKLGNSAVFSELLEKIVFEGKTYEQYLRMNKDDYWLILKNRKVQIVFEDKTIVVGHD